MVTKMTINQSDRRVVMEILCYDFFFENYSAVNYFHLPCVISWVKQRAWLACQGTRVGRVHFIFSFLQIFQFATALKMAGPESVAKFSFQFSRERKGGGGGEWGGELENINVNCTPIDYSVLLCNGFWKVPM